MWNPHLQRQISNLEKVNHEFIGFVSYKISHRMNFDDHDLQLLDLIFLKLDHLDFTSTFIMS